MGFNLTELDEQGGDEPRLISIIPDAYLSLLIFPLFFWLFSFIFMAFEQVGILQQYRLRTSAEAGKLNKVTPWECARNVLGNQTLELSVSVLAMRLLGPSPLSGFWEASPRWVALAALRLLAVAGLDVDRLAGKRLLLFPSSPPDLQDWLVTCASHLAIPATQLLVALFVADTWQYFAHRFFHTNRFFYSRFYLWVRETADVWLVGWLVSWLTIRFLQELSIRGTIDFMHPIRLVPSIFTRQKPYFWIR